MRLTDLEPRWLSIVYWSLPLMGGVSFLCPHCRALRIGVWFTVPIEPGQSMRAFGTDWAQVLAGYRLQAWTRDGTTFDDLTLVPSIRQDGHWHGNITHGEVVTS